MTWRLATSLMVLQREIAAAHPDRPKVSDGTIGDPRHAASKSDHNPTAPHAGVVTAWDITTAPFTDELAETLRLMGAAGDKRIKYVIYKRRITTRDMSGWKPYTGSSAHMDHIHLSVSNDPTEYDRTDTWLTTDEEIEMTKDELRLIVREELAKAVKKLHDEHVLILHGSPGHNGIDTIISRLPKAEP